MKVLLINPSLTLEDRYEKILKHFGENAAPLGLAYIASPARQAGYDVSIIDAPAENYSTDQIVKIIVDNRIKLIGITMLTPLMFGCVRELANKIKCKSPDTIIVIGGAHSTALPEDTLEKIQCDIVCIGEGEKTFVEISDAVLFPNEWN